MRRTLSVSTAVAILLSMAVVGSTMARAERQQTQVGWHPQTGLAGPVGPDAQAWLVRRSDGVSFSFRTTNLRPGHAYTIWFVVINNPAACTSTPCSGPDVVLNPATDSQVTYGAGHVSGGAGRGAFAGSFHAGAIEGWLPNGGMWDPMTAQIQLVLNDHGPVIPSYLPEMTHTYRAGCTDASIPPIFPPSAFADGTPGPNACQLYQVAAFLT